MLGGDLLILPSSVHETIILRREARLEYNEIAALVKKSTKRKFCRRTCFLILYIYITVKMIRSAGWLDR